MKAIFLGSRSQEQFFKVYNEEVREKLQQELTLSPEVLHRDMLDAKLEYLKDVDFIFSTWGMDYFSEDEIRHYFPSLKAVFYAAGTVQSFARPFLNCGIKVFSAWAANAIPVAEYAVAQIILANKGYFQSTRIFKQDDRQKSSEYCKHFSGNFNCKVGIIGIGMIGSLIANMLKAYNLQVLAYDPFLSNQKADELGIEKCSLETLFKECQTISNHTANNEQTKNMLNYDLFSLMKDYSTFINTGRGAQVVEADLIQALTEKPSRTAVLDVTFPEPPEANHPFYKMENVILTPHIAGSMGEEIARMGEYMYSEYRAYIDNKLLKYEVTLKMLETMA